jgi:type II secretory pathway component PulF
MPEFRFKALDVAGKPVQGVSSAQSEEDLAGILHRQGIFLMESEEVGSSAAEQAAKVPYLERLNRWVQRRRRVSLKDVAFFTSQLSVMVRTALPISESLELMAEQATNHAFKRILKDVEKRVSMGTALSAAFAAHPNAFDSIFTSLLAAGEAGGRLDVMLERLAHHLDFRLQFQAKVRSALVYPCIVLLTGFLVVLFLLLFVLPTFREIFGQLNVQLPLPTRVLFFLSDTVRNYWYVFLSVAVSAAAGFRVWLLAPGNRLKWDRFVLSVPVLGTLVRNIVLTRILRTMSSMLESGVSILRILDLCKSTADNAVFHELLEQATRDVRDGAVLSKALARGKHIPPPVISMIATGERTGSLAEVIGRVSDFYESQTDSAIKDLFTALEPLFIIVLGLMVGGIAVSVLLPMFELARNIT